jgi:hypothetical protein
MPSNVIRTLLTVEGASGIVPSKICRSIGRHCRREGRTFPPYRAVISDQAPTLFGSSFRLLTASAHLNKHREEKKVFFLRILLGKKRSEQMKLLLSF